MCISLPECSQMCKFQHNKESIIFLYRMLTLNSFYLSGYDLENLLQNNHNQSHAYNSLWFHITGHVKDHNHVLLTLYLRYTMSVSKQFRIPFYDSLIEREFENTQNLLSRLRGETESVPFSLFSLLRTEPLAHALNQATHKQNRKVIILI